jgi:hypothetical protein
VIISAVEDKVTIVRRTLLPSTMIGSLLVAIALAASSAVAQDAVPSHFANNLESCIAASQPLNGCLNSTLEELRTAMSIGIPGLNVKKMEPLEIPQLDFNNKDPAGIPLLTLNFSTSFRNVVVRGLSTFHTNEISADVNRRVIYMSLTLPRLYINGLYRASGIIGFFHVAGDGSFESVLEGVTGKGHARIVPVTKPDGQTRISITDTNLDFNIDKSNLKLQSSKDRDLFEAVSGFINSNSNILIEQLKPEIKTRMKVMMERVLNDAFSNIPADDVLKHFHDTPPQLRSARTLFPNDPQPPQFHPPPQLYPQLQPQPQPQNFGRTGFFSRRWNL